MEAFENINNCMSSICNLNSKITEMKCRIATLSAVINKQAYIQENISLSISGYNLQLCYSTQAGTDTHNGADMIMLGVRKILNANLYELECKLKLSKESLARHANNVNNTD